MEHLFKLTKPFILSTITSLLYSFSLASNATTTSGSLAESALVTTNCSLNSASLNFGDYDPIGANKTNPLYGTVTFQIACTKGSSVTIAMNNGLYSQNAVQTTRAMSSGNGTYLSYELYSNSAHTSVWSSTNPVHFTSTTSAPLVESIYGSIPGGQNIQAGTYTDTVVITATF